MPSTLGPSPLTAAAVRDLISRAEAPAVSLLMPIEPIAPRSNHARLTLKNLVSQARQQLANWPWHESGGDRLLAAAQAHLDDDTWWQGPGRGFAYFASASGEVAKFRLPFAVGPRAVVDSQYAGRELLPALTADGEYGVLAISQKQVRLYWGNRFGLEPVEGIDSPASLAEAMELSEHSNDLNRHGGSPYGSGVHGQASARDARKGELAQFFRKVDSAIIDALKDRSGPLVLALDAPLAPMYRSVSRWPRIADEVIAGNPERLAASELHERSWSVVAPLFDAERRSHVDAFVEAGGTGLASTDPAEIVAAAAAGRVAVLFIPNHRPLWGRFDPVALGAAVHAEREPGDEDLVNRAAVETIAHSGLVYEATELRGADLGARFRY